MECYRPPSCDNSILGVHVLIEARKTNGLDEVRPDNILCKPQYRNIILLERMLVVWVRCHLGDLKNSTCSTKITYNCFLRVFILT